MEENKSKNGAGVVVLLIMSVIVIAVLGALIYVLQTNNNKLATDTNNSEQTINALKTEIESLKNTIAQKENEIKSYENKETVTQTKEMTSDEKYASFLNNLKKSITNINKYSNIEESYSIIGEDGGYTFELNSKCELSVHFTDKEREKNFGTDKLATDVVAFYNCYVGNGGMQLLYFIKSDGTLWEADIEGCLYSGQTKISIKKVSEYKNIISVLNFYSANSDEYPGAMSPVFVDIDGKVYNNN